jgi:hypothetical protein
VAARSAKYATQIGDYEQAWKPFIAEQVASMPVSTGIPIVNKGDGTVQ